MTQQEGISAPKPTARDLLALDVERATVIAEAKAAVKRLDMYLEWIGKWAIEGWDEDDAA